MTGSKPAARRTFAIGDIHGCADALQAVIDAIDPQPSDEIVTLGDYIDRGPSSRQVIEQLLELRKRCQLVTLMGNHELMLLEALESVDHRAFWMRVGGDATVESYQGLIENIPPEHIEFIRACLPYYENAENIFVHANYDGSLPLADQPDELLYWRHLTQFRPAAHCSRKTAIVGHTPQVTGEILDLDYVICIYTHCFGRGYLTAYNCANGETIQAGKSGDLRS